MECGQAPPSIVREAAKGRLGDRIRVLFGLGGMILRTGALGSTGVTMTADPPNAIPDKFLIPGELGISESGRETATAWVISVQFAAQFGIMKR